MTIEDLDFSFNPKIPAAVIRDLATLRLVEAGESVVMHGPVGVGKSHVAQALGQPAGHSWRSPRPPGCWPTWPADTPTEPGRPASALGPTGLDPRRLRHARVHRGQGRRPLRAGQRAGRALHRPHRRPGRRGPVLAVPQPGGGRVHPRPPGQRRLPRPHARAQLPAQPPVGTQGDQALTTCAAIDRDNVVARSGPGRPAISCSPACPPGCARRSRTPRTPPTAGTPAGLWNVSLRCGSHSVLIAENLGWLSATDLSS